MDRCLHWILREMLMDGHMVKKRDDNASQILGK